MDKEILELIKIQQKFNDDFKNDIKMNIQEMGIWNKEFKEDIKEFKDEIKEYKNENEKIIKEIKENHLKHIENDMIEIKNSNMWIARIGTGIIFVLVGLFLKAIFGGL